MQTLFKSTSRILQLVNYALTLTSSMVFENDFFWSTTLIKSNLNIYKITSVEPEQTYRFPLSVELLHDRRSSAYNAVSY